MNSKPHSYQAIYESGLAAGFPAVPRSAVNMTGKTYGEQWKALFYIGSDRSRIALWRFECVRCGYQTQALSRDVRWGEYPRCPCEGPPPPYIPEPSETPTGYETDGAGVRSALLRDPDPSRRAAASSWTWMQKRCYQPRRFGRYKQKGITACTRYRHHMTAFVTDLGPRPAPGMTADRIDNRLGYNCGRCDDCQTRGLSCNVRWLTKRGQRHNRSDSPQYAEDRT